MKRMHYSWAEYGFTLANWRPCLADALVQSAIFVGLVTLLKWGLARISSFCRTIVRAPFLPWVLSAICNSDRGDLRVLLFRSRSYSSRCHSEFAYPFPDWTLHEDEGRFDDNAHRLCCASGFEKPDFAASRYPPEYFLVLAILQVPLAARRDRVAYHNWRLGAFYIRYPRGIREIS